MVAGKTGGSFQGNVNPTSDQVNATFKSVQRFVNAPLQGFAFKGATIPLPGGGGLAVPTWTSVSPGTAKLYLTSNNQTVQFPQVGLWMIEALITGFTGAAQPCTLSFQIFGDGFVGTAPVGLSAALTNASSVWMADITKLNQPQSTDLPFVNLIVTNQGGVTTIPNVSMFIGRIGPPVSLLSSFTGV